MMTIKKNEYGQYLCPMPDCNEELYLVIEGNVALCDDSGPTVTFKESVTDGWKVTCTEGHVVLLPPSGGPHEEYATFGRSCKRCCDIVDEGDTDIKNHDDFARLEALYLLADARTA
jgi:hypothetical protein